MNLHTSPIIPAFLVFVLMLLLCGPALAQNGVCPVCPPSPYPFNCSCPFSPDPGYPVACICPFYPLNLSSAPSYCSCPFTSASSALSASCLCPGISSISDPNRRTTGLSARFSANTTTGSTPLAVQFTDSSTGRPNRWQWDFGDGSTSTLQNPLHSYTQPGVYTVSLTISREFVGSTTVISESRSLTRDNYITVNGAAAPVVAPATEAFSQTTLFRNTGNMRDIIQRHRL